MIGQLARHAPTYTELDLLEGAIAELESGWPVIVDRGDHTYQLLLPQAAVGHRGTRRLADLPLTPVKPLPEDTPVPAAIAHLRDAGTDFAMVARNGDIVGLVSYATLLADIAPNDLAGEDLLALEHILADSGDAFVLLDAKNRVRMSNASGLSLLRRLTERDDDEPIASLAGVAIETLLKDSAGGSSVRDLVARREGVRKVIEVRVLCPVDDTSGRTLLLLRDVTAAREAEKDAARRTQMSGFGQLAGAMAHDFNNVLTVISAQASLLQHRLRHDPSSAESAASILDATKLAAELVARLRSFARKEPVTPRALDIDAVLAGLRRLVPELAGRGVEVMFDVAGDLEPIVADPTQIERALANLASNAGLAMPDGGQLRVAAEMITLDPEHPDALAAGGNYLRLAVSDTGAGMDEHTLARCFDPHFTTRPGAGMGLGLATVYSIVSDLGGHVRVRSKVGEGTTLELLLPTTRTAGPLAGIRVLVVDDDRHVAEAVTQILATEGAKAVSASSAEDALGHLDAHGVPDVLIADVRMPGRSGTELIEEIREHAPDLHAVLMTGEVDPTIVDAAGRLRVELVRKPFTPEALVSAITVAIADTLEQI